jgi:hypothetical protein
MLHVRVRGGPRLGRALGRSLRRVTLSSRRSRCRPSSPRPSAHDRACRPRRSRASRATSPRAESAAVYGRVGICHQPHGSLAAWLLYALATRSPATSIEPAARCSRPRGRGDEARAHARVRRRLRPLEEPRARPARGRGRAAGRHARRRDRDERRRAGARAAHVRGQPGALGAQRQEARRALSRLVVHGERRRLPERDDPPRERHLAAGSAARALPLRRRAQRVRRAQFREVRTAPAAQAARRKRRLGDPARARRSRVARRLDPRARRARGLDALRRAARARGHPRC